jgi:hypothetical protein
MPEHLVRQRTLEARAAAQPEIGEDNGAEDGAHREDHEHIDEMATEGTARCVWVWLIHRVGPE